MLTKEERDLKNSVWGKGYHTAKTKTRRYDKAYLALGFTSKMMGNEEKPRCILFLKILVPKLAY